MRILELLEYRIETTRTERLPATRGQVLSESLLLVWSITILETSTSCGI